MNINLIQKGRYNMETVLYPDKTSDTHGFDFEKTIKIFSTISFSIGLVIYSFTLGYFHRLEIPGNPSFLTSIRFYLLSSLKSFYLKPEIFLGLFCIFASIYWVTSKVDLKDKYTLKTIFQILICAFFFAMPILIFNKELSLFAPVILSALLGSIYYIVIESKNLSKEKKVFSLIPYSLFTLALSYWAFSAIDLSFFDKTKLNSYFPNGFGIKLYEPSNLVWSEENKNFWYNCQESRGVIFGTTNEEKIFIRTEMSDKLNGHLCSYAE